MANQYYYDIVYLDTKTTSHGHEKAVVNVAFHLVGTHDDGTVVRFEGNTVIPEPESGSEFVEFGNLQANTVVSWIESNISDEYLNKCKNACDQAIEEKRNSTQPRDLPWV
jgi:hypothetical protein